MNRFSLFAAGLALAFSPALAHAGDKKGDPEKGKDVFQQCSVCHNADTTEKKMGPGLKGLFSKEKMNNGKKPLKMTEFGSKMKSNEEPNAKKR